MLSKSKIPKPLLLLAAVILFLLANFFFSCKTIQCIGKYHLNLEDHQERAKVHKEQLKEERNTKADCANVFFLSSDNYFQCTAVAIYSLKYWAETETNIILMVTPGVSLELVKLLEQELKVRVVYVDFVNNPNVHVSNERFRNNYTKLRNFELPYKKVIYQDSDFLILRNTDELCSLEAPFGSSTNYASKLKTWGDPNYFNAGFYVADTGKNDEVFKSLLHLADNFVSETGGDQPLMNEYFKDNWAHLDKHIYGANANSYEPHRHLWDPNTIKSFHMTYHFNPCNHHKHPEIWVNFENQYKSGTLDPNHPVALWFKARDEMLLKFPALLSNWDRSFEEEFCDLVIPYV